MSVTSLRIYVEQGSSRVFCGAVDWPGLDRGGRNEQAAIAALIAAAARYRRDMGAAARDLVVPAAPAEVEVVDRHAGDAATDFGIPSHGADADEAPVDDAGLPALTDLVAAAWATFDRAVDAARGVELRKGPRGGGRDLDRIVEHVAGADAAYLRSIGGRRPTGVTEDAAGLAAIREAALAALAERARGVEVELGRRTKPLWTPRYFVRRAAWHALDHAWEIEDRRER